MIVPAGYLTTAAPFGLTFTGKAYSEATLISLAYALEQATKVRQPPGSAWRRAFSTKLRSILSKSRVWPTTWLGAVLRSRRSSTPRSRAKLDYFTLPC